METNLIEVECDNPTNGNVRFRPLQANVRGRWEWPRCGPEYQRVAQKWGALPIPGQRIQYDPAKGVLAIVDPLHDAEHEAVREKVEKAGYKLPPRREEHEGIDRNTALHWLKRLVDSGHARLTKGQFPTDIDHKKARRDFLFAPRTEPTRDELLVIALQAQATAFNRMADVLEKALTKR